MVGLEFWAKEYLKAEGGFFAAGYSITCSRILDSSSLVSLKALKKAYENLQLGVSSIYLYYSKDFEN